MADPSGSLAPLQRHPFVQVVQERLRSLPPDCQTLLGAELLDLTLDLVDAGQLLQRALGDPALVGRVQIEELAPRVGEAAHLGDAGSQNASATPATEAAETWYSATIWTLSSGG